MVNRVADRLLGFAEASGIRYVPFHVILSPPIDQVDPPKGGLLDPEVMDQKMSDLLDQAKMHVKGLAIHSAVIIPHGYRIKDHKKREANQGATDTDQDRYRWCMDQDDPWEFLEWSPHFHIIGWGFLEASDKFEKRTGWIYKKKQPRPWKDVAPTISYLLSHAWLWLSPSRNLYRYLGGLSSTKLLVEVRTAWEEEACPVCGRPVRRIPLDDLGRPLFLYEDAPISRIKVEIRTYRLRSSRGPGPPSRPYVQWYEDQDNPVMAQRP